MGLAAYYDAQCLVSRMRADARWKRLTCERAQNPVIRCTWYDAQGLVAVTHGVLPPVSAHPLNVNQWLPALRINEPYNHL